mmetsp:Transcript_120146/g.208594  ORF Transcript_120146/g.208594 Transcript_120146/m.208594 type:complete len:89 (+) Transcript_120146:22-288(+)
MTPSALSPGELLKQLPVVLNDRPLQLRGHVKARHTQSFGMNLYVENLPHGFSSGVWPKCNMRWSSGTLSRAAISAPDNAKSKMRRFSS